MGELLSVYARVIRAQLRSQRQYRVSFVLELLGSMVISLADLATVLALLAVTGTLGGFDGGTVFLIAALSTASFAIGDLVGGGLDRMRDYVRTGQFDALLLRPLSTLAQVMVATLAFRRAGRAMQGVVLYGVGLVIADIDWDPARVALAVVAPLAGAVFFTSLFVAGATVAFWWVESGEVANAFTYGGRDFTSYPMTVYGDWFRQVFAFGLGFGFVAYLPALAIVDVPDPLGTPDWARWCAPLVAVVAALVARLVWRWGTRHYRSTGS